MRTGSAARQPRHPPPAPGSHQPPTTAWTAPLRQRTPAALILLALLSACAPRSFPGPAPHELRALLDVPPYGAVHWGLLVFDPATGDTLLSRNADRRFVPASNQKILTTVAALLALGTEHRFETALVSTSGPVGRDGVVTGDLVLPGRGDPSLSARFHDDDRAALGALADSVWRAGVRRVRGSLVIDASRWDSTTVEGTWMVGDLPYAYAATGGAFALAEGVTTIRVEATGPGQPARVEWSPLGEPAFVRSEVRTVTPDDSPGPGVRVAWLPEARRLHLTGTVTVGAVDTIRVATRDPLPEAGRALLTALGDRGVTVEGGLRVAWDSTESFAGGCGAGQLAACPSAARVAGIASPPLLEITEAILEPSQNWMSEQLLWALGEAREGRASWGTGRRALTQILGDSLGVDSLSLNPVDGSGLSAYNLLTPRALGRILAEVRDRPWGAAWREALPAPGEEDSTLEHRLPGLEESVRAKTGTIRHVNSLSGYLTTASGRELVFVFLSNGSGLPSARVRERLDALTRAFVEERPLTSPSGAPPAPPGIPPR